MKTRISFVVFLFFFALIHFSKAQQPLVANAGNDTLICTGDSILLGGTPIATGGIPPYSYNWSPSNCGVYFQPLLICPYITTTYTLTVADMNGTTATDVVTVSASPQPEYVMHPDTLIPHHYLITNNSTGVPPLNYLWDWGDGTFDTIAYPSHTYSAAGYYNICLTVTDGLNCTFSFCYDSTYLQKEPKLIISVDVIPPVTAVLSNSKSAAQVFVYPNPVRENLFIKSPHYAVVEIRDINGQNIKTINDFKNSFVLNVSGMPSGVYILRFKTDSGLTTRKIIIE